MSLWANKCSFRREDSTAMNNAVEGLDGISRMKEKWTSTYWLRQEDLGLIQIAALIVRYVELRR